MSYTKRTSQLRPKRNAGHTYSSRSASFRRGGGAPTTISISNPIYPISNFNDSDEMAHSHNESTKNATALEGAIGHSTIAQPHTRSSATSGEIAQLRQQLSDVQKQSDEKLAVEKGKHEAINKQLRQQLEECQEEKMDLAIINSTMQVEGEQIDKLKTEIDKLRAQLQFKTEELRKSDAIKLKLQKQQQHQHLPHSQHFSRSRSSVTKKIAKVVPSKKRNSTASMRSRSNASEKKSTFSDASRRRVACELSAATTAIVDPPTVVTRTPSEILLMIVNRILLQECKKELMQLMFSSGSLDATTAQLQSPLPDAQKAPTVRTRRQVATNLSPFFRRSATKFGSPMLGVIGDTPTPSKRLQQTAMSEEGAELTKSLSASASDKPLASSSDLCLPFLTPSVGSGINSQTSRTPVCNQAKTSNMQWLSKQFNANSTVIMDWIISQTTATAKMTRSAGEEEQGQIVQNIGKTISAIGSFIHLVLVAATNSNIGIRSSFTSPSAREIAKRTTVSQKIIADFHVFLESSLKVRFAFPIVILAVSFATSFSVKLALCRTLVSWFETYIPSFAFLTPVFALGIVYTC